MIRNLLDRVEPQRRHLALLVGMLVLTFVLTVVLAVQARQADLARQDQSKELLRDLSGRAAVEWEKALESQVAGATMRSVVGAAHALETDPTLPLDQVASLFNVRLLCGECSEVPAATYFSIDLASGELQMSAQGGPVPGARYVELVRDRVGAGGFSLLNDNNGVMLILDGDGGATSTVAVVVLSAEGRPVRTVGYIVPTAVLADAFAATFRQMLLLPAPMSKGMPNDSFFSYRMAVGEVTLLDGGYDGGFAVVHHISRAPFAGLSLHVGVRDNAETRLLLSGAVSSAGPLLLTLLIMICGLLAISLLLVRREVELVRLRADFVSGVSHELRTPLAQIRMFTETLLLNRVRSDVERRRSLEIIDQEARRLTHLVENVLLFSKSEGGRRAPLAPEPTDLAQEVRRAVDSFGPMCRMRSVTVRTELQDSIVVAVDRGALRQIMVNLLDNALKYGPAAQRVTVGVALFDDVARVWVDDEGPGIPEADRERVFESFFRLRRNVEATTTGSGIGLAVVRELSRLHGGDARVETAPGGGARVVAEFPDAYFRQEPVADLATAS
jgi:signal transduction histidine kinase